ncbi:hypothetical protein [Streptomyces sp. NBC_01445]|uniref:hypothetical protein n=1 Tax=Streptomyces sp. NBC_01445 TaxID=2903869 RepID=UPI002DDB52BB|nr:hypothetical protein [Streptomyces sp. NBC_01445]WSE03768.1 hypothetical protein OG574_10550 [Streptomyces sp. NBC_01445]
MTTQASHDAQADSTPLPHQRRPDQPPHLRTGLIDLSEGHLWHERLGTDLRALGIQDPVPLRVRVALRRRAHLTTWTRRLLTGACWAISAVLVSTFNNTLVWFVGTRDDEPVGDDQNPLLHHQLLPLGLLKPPQVVFFRELSPAFQSLSLTLIGALAFGLVWAAAMYLVSFLAKHGRPSVLTWFLCARRYALVMQCADAVHACAEAHGAGGERQASALRRVSRQLRVVLRNLPDAPSARRSVPRFSSRKRALKAHARHVVGALRTIEFKIDSEPDVALRELSCALVQVSNRYCHARLGVLLDEHYLKDVEQPPNRELLRWVLALLVAGGSVTGLAVSGVLPESAEPIVYAIAILLSLTIAFGRKIQRSVEILAAITGGP